MININKINKNEIEIVYNTVGGVKSYTQSYRPLKITESKNGSLSNLKGDKTYEFSNDEGDYAYTCLYNDKYERDNTFLNTVLTMPKSFIDELTTPKLIFYDIETNDKAVPKKNGRVSSEARINSIAWVDAESNEEFCLVRGVDGLEGEIIERFVDYCKDNKVMGVVGHNSFGFDNRVMIARMKELKFDYEDISIFYSACNLDTMVLAKFLQYSAHRMISLNNLAELLGVNDSKIDTGVYNPITLYEEALKDESKLGLFKEYNIQDVRLTKRCFEGMNALEQLTELFKQTLCPFNKVHMNQELLNSFTCKEALANGIVIPDSQNTEIDFKNEGGFNYYQESEQLNIYENVVCFDVVSYYPHLLMLIGADTTYPYDNIDKETGEIGKFTNTPDGFLGKLARNLYDSRAMVKAQMKQTSDEEEKRKLDNNQKSKKIIVNSLYGVLSQAGGYYVLRDELIGATITALGRDLLRNVVNEFGGIYAKTDSVFIQLKEDQDAETVLFELNDYVNKFFADKYNLNNFSDGKQLVRFEIDSILDSIIIKDKNNYVKIADGEYKFKGGSFTSSTMSEYEKDLTNNIVNSLVSSNADVVNDAINFTKEKLDNVKDLDYYAKTQSLSSKQINNKVMRGRYYMDDLNIPYSYGFKYQYCRVHHQKYDYIMFPKGHTPDLPINSKYVFDLMIRQLKNLKLIDNDEVRQMKKHYGIKTKSDKLPDEDQRSLYDIPNPEPDVKPCFSRINNKFIKELANAIPDTAEYYENSLIKFVPLKAKSKDADIKGFSFKSKEFIQNYNVEEDIGEDNNFGIVRGFNGLCCLDIDGDKQNLSEENNKVLKACLLGILDNIDYPFIIQSTVSGGYHLFYCSHNNSGFNLKNIKYPDDFFIKELQGQSLGTHTIEVFEKMNGAITFAPSVIDNKKYGKGNYELFSNDYTWEQIFSNPVEDMSNLIDAAFAEKGFTIEPRKKVVDKPNFIASNTLKKINENEIKSVSESFSSLLEIADKTKCKYHISLALGGFFSNHIDEESTAIICNNVVDKVGNLMEDTDLFINTVIDNYESDAELKTGLPTVAEYLHDDDDSINELVDNHITNIHNICVDSDDRSESQRNEKELYGLSYDSLANYAGDIPYVISNEFVSAIKLELEKLYELCKEFEYNGCGLSEVVSGSLYHYGLTEDDIRDILKGSNIDMFVEYTKNPDLIVKLGRKQLVYGFSTLKRHMVFENEDDEDSEKLEGIIKRISGIIQKATKLNPYFYACGENNNFKQDRGQFKKDGTVLLNCAFDEIVKHEQAGFINDSTIVTSLYDITVRFKNGETKTLRSYTLDGLFKFLKSKNLYMNKPDADIERSIRTFFNEVENRGDIQIKKMGYIEGFLLERNNGSFNLMYNLPNLDFSTPYTIEDGILELNTIYNDIFNSNIKFISCMKWYLIHSLRGLFAKWNVLNQVARQLINVGVEGTGKTLRFTIYQYFFNSEPVNNIGGEADSVASLNRVLGNSTFPLIMDDPTVPIKDFYAITKKVCLTTKGPAKAAEQYGRGVNEYDVTRQTVYLTNDIPMSAEGFNRRNFLLTDVRSEKLTNENKEVLNQHSIDEGNGVQFLKLNSIGVAFVKWLEHKIPLMNGDDIREVASTMGTSLIDEFLGYINSISEVKLDEDFFSIDSYKFETLETNYRFEFYDRFKYHVTNGERINFTQYSRTDLETMASKVWYLHLETDGRSGNPKVVIEWDGIKEFLKADYGLKIPMDQETFYETLELPKDLTFKDAKFNGQRATAMKMSVQDFYKYFFNSHVE